MKRLFILALVLLAAPFALAQNSTSLPQIGVQRKATLSPSYSCRSAAGFLQYGYDKTALFLTDSMKEHNSPDLLFNGACGSWDYFQSSTHGGNRSVIVDLASGTSPSALLALSSSGGELNSKTLETLGFKVSSPVVMGHTYAVLLDKHDVRGLLVFTVTDYVKNSRVAIDYKVLDYRISEKVSKDVRRK